MSRTFESQHAKFAQLYAALPSYLPVEIGGGGRSPTAAGATPPEPPAVKLPPFAAAVRAAGRNCVKAAVPSPVVAALMHFQR